MGEAIQNSLKKQHNHTSHGYNGQPKHFDIGSISGKSMNTLSTYIKNLFFVFVAFMFITSHNRHSSISISNLHQ